MRSCASHVYHLVRSRSVQLVGVSGGLLPRCDADSAEGEVRYGVSMLTARVITSSDRSSQG